MRLARMAASLMRRRLSWSSGVRSSCGHDLGEGQDAAQRVVDLVGHPAGELTERRHLLGLEQAPGHLPLLRDVLPDHHQGVAAEREGPHQPDAAAKGDDPLRRLRQVQARAGELPERVVDAVEAVDLPHRHAGVARERHVAADHLAAAAHDGERIADGVEAGPPLLGGEPERLGAGLQLGVEVAVQPLQLRLPGGEHVLESVILLDHPELRDGVLDGEQEVGLVPRFPDEAEDSERLTASSMAAVSACPVRRTRWIAGSAPSRGAGTPRRPSRASGSPRPRRGPARAPGCRARWPPRAPRGRRSSSCAARAAGSVGRVRRRRRRGPPPRGRARRPSDGCRRSFPFRPCG